MSQFEKAVAAYQGFTDDIQSVMLSTVNEAGFPNASYAPCIVDQDRTIYIYVSGLSTHTQNLYATAKASVLFIEDEAKSSQIFARRRLTYDCKAMILEREEDRWDQIADQFQDRFGRIIKLFRELNDFRIFQLTPIEGRFVVGFGAAFQIRGNDLNNLVHLTGDGHGQRRNQAEGEQAEPGNEPV